MLRHLNCPPKPVHPLLTSLLYFVMQVLIPGLAEKMRDIVCRRGLCTKYNWQVMQ